MAEAKLAPNLPGWMLEHANRYLASGGTDGHMYKVNVPGRGEITAPALMLTTTGRKSGDKVTIFRAVLWNRGRQLFPRPSPQREARPNTRVEYRNILANPDVEGPGRDQKDERPGQDNGG